MMIDGRQKSQRKKKSFVVKKVIAYLLSIYETPKKLNSWNLEYLETKTGQVQENIRFPIIREKHQLLF